MILGKRPRPPIKRTTSMKEFASDLNRTDIHGNPQPPYDPNHNSNTNPPPDDHRFLTSTVSPRNYNYRRHSADHMGTPHFLAVCHLCNRRLVPGSDIFMYRGDSAFCSLECRQQQMIQDEKTPSLIRRKSAKD